MKELLKNISSIILGMLIFLAAMLLLMFLLKGDLWFSKKIFPWATIIFYTTIIVDIIILLPLSFFRKTREVGMVGLLISSYLFGLVLWVYSFLTVYSVWGWEAIIIGTILAGVGVIPIAVVAVILNSQWVIFLQLVLLIILTFGIKFRIMYVAEKNEIYFEE